MYDDADESDISVTMIRNGVILGQKSFYFFSDDFGENSEEGFLNFCFQYYGNSSDVLPRKLLLDLSEDNFALMSEAFLQAFESKINWLSRAQNMEDC